MITLDWKVRRSAVGGASADRCDRLPRRTLLLVVFASRDGQDAPWRTDLLQHAAERALCDVIRPAVEQLALNLAPFIIIILALIAVIVLFSYST